MQNAGLAALGLDWRYLAFEVRPDDLREAIAGAKAMRYLGLNLTVPHKLLAVPMVDALDESARVWGAVNTIRFEGRDADGVWQPLRVFAETTPEQIRAHGFNTDADAVVRSISEDLGLGLAGASVLLLGAGGAGRVAALKLAAENVAELFLIKRHGVYPLCSHTHGTRHVPVLRYRTYLEAERRLFEHGAARLPCLLGFRRRPREVGANSFRWRHAEVVVLRLIGQAFVFVLGDDRQDAHEGE